MSESLGERPVPRFAWPGIVTAANRGRPGGSDGSRRTHAAAQPGVVGSLHFFTRFRAPRLSRLTGLVFLHVSTPRKHHRFTAERVNPRLLRAHNSARLGQRRRNSRGPYAVAGCSFRSSRESPGRLAARLRTSDGSKESSVPLPCSGEEVRVSRRLLMLCVFALLAQLGTGCYHLRQRIAWRWANFHGCGACCTPCTPAFRIPSSPAPVIGTPVGCPTCYSPGGESHISAPVIVPGPGTGGPVITSPTPLGSGPMVIPMQPGIPSPMPSKPGN